MQRVNERIIKRLKIFVAAVIVMSGLVTAFSINAFAAGNPVKDGWYMIEIGNHSGRVLEVQDYSTQNAAAIQVGEKKNTVNQRFQLKYLGNGYYAIRNWNSGKYLDKATNTDLAKGGDAIQWTWNGKDNQLWELIDAGNGYYYIKNKSGSWVYLDNPKAITTPGNKLFCYEYTGKCSQWFKFIWTTQPTLVSNITLNMASVTKAIGESFKLSVKITPENATNKSVNWSSQNSEVATVDGNGSVKVVGYGTTKITAVAKDDSHKEASCIVSCLIPESSQVTGVGLNVSDYSLRDGQVVQLKATVYPDTVSNKNVSWKSSDDKVAIVDAQGKVTGVKKGEAIITVTTADGKKKASCSIHVDPYDPIINVKNGYYLIKSACDENYVLDVSGASTEDRSNVQLYKKHGGTNQRMRLWYQNNGYYSICAWHSGKFIYRSSADTALQIGWKEWASQYWALENAGGGYYYIRNRDGLYLDNRGGIVKNGNQIITYPFTGSNAQKWKLEWTTQPVKAQSVSLSGKPGGTIYVGNAGFTLKAAVLPSNTTYKAVAWSSSNESVASVDQNGKVTIKSAGKTTITTKTKDGSNRTATCVVEVKQKSVTTTYYVSAKSTLVLRDSASTKGKKILSMPRGAAFNVSQIQNGWAYGQYGGKYGYASLDYLSKSKPSAASSGKPKETAKPEKTTEKAKTPSAKPLPNISGLSAAERLARIAESQIGYFGGVGGGGYGHDNTVYGAYTNANPAQWCASFVSWCSNKANISKTVIPKTASTLTMGKSSKEYIKWNKKAIYSIKRGDVIFFSTYTSLEKNKKKAVHHVGVVSQIDSKNNYIWITEGNTGKDLVLKRKYTVIDISNGKFTGNGWKGEYFCGYISTK